MSKEEMRQKLDAVKILFCHACSMVPSYSIEIKTNNVFINHICSGINSRKEIKLLKNIYMEEENICNLCANICDTFCLKCGINICSNCFPKHFNYYLIEKEEDEKDNFIIEEEEEDINNNALVTIYKKQFICMKHIIPYSHFCDICQINLCQDCLKYHYHINNKEFSNIVEEKNIVGNFKTEEINAQVISDLAYISQIFEKCFIQCKSRNNYTLNILLNYYLIKEINNYIKNSCQNKEINYFVIKNKLNLQDKKEENYIFKNFYSDKFIEYYNDLILGVQAGHIDAFHQLENIKNYYMKKNLKVKNKSSYNSIKNSYNFILEIEAKNIKTDIVLIQNMIQSSNLD
jgi:hypothetical protein